MSKTPTRKSVLPNRYLSKQDNRNHYYRVLFDELMPDNRQPQTLWGAYISPISLKKRGNTDPATCQECIDVARIQVTFYNSMSEK